MVALGILAAVASVTLSLLEHNVEKDRFERTAAVGSAVREVINGSSEQDGISRFISDMGRLPVIINTDTSGKVLAELFDNNEVEQNTKWAAGVFFQNASSNLPATDVAELKFPDEFTNLNLPCGWSGPYIIAPYSTLFDGWKNEWLTLDNNGATQTAALNKYIYGIRSNGSDGESGGTEWSEQDLVYRFNTDGKGASTSSDLIVTVLIMNKLGATSVLEAPENLKTVSAASWQSDHEYEVGSCIINNNFRYRCLQTLPLTQGKSSSSCPTELTAAADTVNDHNLVWQKIGSGSEPGWKASSLYRRNDRIQVGANVYECTGIRPVSGGTAPTFKAVAGQLTYDGDLVWICDYPFSKTMNRLRVAFFEPCVTSTAKGIKRLMAVRNGTTVAALDQEVSFNLGSFAAFKQPAATWTDYNQVHFSNLTPGTRKIYAYGYLQSGSSYSNKLGSDVIGVQLKPGINCITLILNNSLQE